VAGSVHTSSKMTLTPGFCEQVAGLVAQLVRARAWAMVSPLTALAAVIGWVLGKGAADGDNIAPQGPPATQLVPSRPCERSWPPDGSWQPLQRRISPGRTCNQTRCCGKSRRPLPSSTEITKATLEGTCTDTEPSGSMCA